MKNSKRNLVILSLMLGVVFYGTSAVISFTAAPIREKEETDTPGRYLRSLKKDSTRQRSSTAVWPGSKLTTG